MNGTTVSFCENRVRVRPPLGVLEVSRSSYRSEKRVVDNRNLSSFETTFLRTRGDVPVSSEIMIIQIKRTQVDDFVCFFVWFYICNLPLK